LALFDRLYLSWSGVFAFFVLPASLSAREKDKATEEFDLFKEFLIDEPKIKTEQSGYFLFLIESGLFYDHTYKTCYNIRAYSASPHYDPSRIGSCIAKTLTRFAELSKYYGYKTMADDFRSILDKCAIKKARSKSNVVERFECLKDCFRPKVSFVIK